MAATADLTRLTTFQHHIDDMRNLVGCKICLKPLYEPFILSCGHTYCYGCLRSWFSGLDSRRRKKNCPDCRAEVKLTPAPNYILRDLVHMFINRAELLPEDETVDEHVAGKISEADLLANDKEGKGLFLGIFRNHSHPLAEFGPLQDIADGVLRCPYCHWEIEDGACNQCGYEIDDDEYPDFSDEDDESIDIGEESIASDDMSNGSGYDSEGLPHHFYGARSLADDADQSIASAINSELEEGNLHVEHYYDDEDDLDGFIDNHHEDEPDEVDEDDMDGFGDRFMPRPLRRHYQIPDDDDDDDDDGDDSQLEGNEDEHEHYNWHPGGPLEASDISEEEEDDESGGDDENQDQLTNYDESDEESRDSAPVAMRSIPRRRPIIISDEEDEHEDRQEDDQESRTVGRSRSQSQNEGAEIQGSDDGGDSDNSDSDDTAIPPQPSATRRLRLDNHRKRRRTPETWRGAARGRLAVPAGRQGTARNSEHTVSHEARPGMHFPGRVFISN